MNLGYACVNLTLSNNSPKVTTNRTMVEAKAKELAILPFLQ